jgi:hypothetical protein
MEQWLNDENYQGKSDVLGEKPDPVPFRPPRISLEITWT